MYACMHVCVRACMHAYMSKYVYVCVLMYMYVEAKDQPWVWFLRSRLFAFETGSLIGLKLTGIG